MDIFQAAFSSINVRLLKRNRWDGGGVRQIQVYTRFLLANLAKNIMGDIALQIPDGLIIDADIVDNSAIFKKEDVAILEYWRDVTQKTRP